MERRLVCRRSRHKKTTYTIKLKLLEDNTYKDLTIREKTRDITVKDNKNKERTEEIRRRQ